MNKTNMFLELVALSITIFALVSVGEVFAALVFVGGCLLGSIFTMGIISDD